MEMPLYSELDLSDYDRVKGIAPSLLDIVAKRVTILRDQLSDPKLDILETQVLRGRVQELYLLRKALQDAGVGRALALRPTIQSPSGAEKI